MSAHTPSIVCLSFSIELGLKSLHLIEHGGYPRGPTAHNFKNLYDGLRDETKRAIQEIALPYYPRYPTPKTFLEYIGDHGEVFSKWRYSCEPGEDLMVSELFLKSLALRIHQLVQQAIEGSLSGDVRETGVGRYRLIIK